MLDAIRLADRIATGEAEVKRLWIVEARASALAGDDDERCSWNGFASDSIEATQLALLSFKNRQLDYAPELLRVVKVAQMP